MSLLSDEFYENLAKTPRMTGHRTTPQPAPEVQPEKALGEKAEEYLSQPMLKTQEKYLSKVPDISPEEQTAKFGGVVGSPEYQKYQAERSILGRMPGEIFSTLGANLPEQEKWDKMSTTDKLLYVSGHALPGAAANFLIKLPRQIITAPIRIGYSAYKDFSTLYGLRGDNKTELNLPVLGTVPTYFKSYDDARKSGQDVLTAAVSTIALAAGDLAISIQGAQALKSVTSPRKVIEGSPTITDAQPIKNAIIQNEFGLKSVKQQVAGSPNKYYQLPGDIAKQYNKGNPNNTFMKISPIDMEGNFELAIVQVRGGVIPKIIDKIRGQKLSQGDFGPEMKFTSDKIPLGKINPKAFADWQNEFATTSKEVGWMGGKDKVITEKNYSEIRKEINKAPSVEQNILDAETRLNELVKQEAEMMRDIQKEVGGVSLIGERGGPLIRASSNPQWYRDFYKANKHAPSKKIILELAKEELEKGSGMFSKEYQGIKTLVEDLKKGESEPKIRETATPEMPEGYGESTEQPSLRNEPPIMPKPLKGMENQPITGKQIGHLKAIEGANKIDPKITESVIKTITGKDNIGDLTQTEYVKVSQVLALFNDTGKYIGATPSLNPAMEWLSPQRYFMKNAESQYGVPIYSEGYVKMENAIQTRNNFRTQWMEKNRETFKVGKTDYGSSKFAEERRLVKAYMEGDMDAILKNTAIDSKVKADLVQIAQRLKPLYEELGKAFGIPADVFLQNYQPHIQNLGGIFVLNKAGSEIPKGMDFFAEHKRTGALSVQVDDALALTDIYVNAGSNKLFLDDVLGNMKALNESLPENLKVHFKEYVQEKLGYAGKSEEYLNQIGAGLNRKIPGLNLSPDWGRKMLQVTLDTTYSGGLGLRPDAMIRNLLQLPILVYPRLGFKFADVALKKALSKEGMAEVKAKGFLVDKGGVYGQELAKETEFTGQVGTAYRKVTQATLKPYGSTDVVTRGAAYWQGKYIWNEAMEKLNSGKIKWDQFEKEIDMKAFDPIDQNIIRQGLVGKNPEAAFNHYIRDIIDQTNFPYRRGASPKAFWGIGGKIGGQFLQFPVEFAHTLGGWLKTGQYDKLIRFYGIATATKRTFEDTFGMDISKWVALGPLAIGSAPFVKAATEIYGMIDSYRNDNAEEFESHKDALIKEVKSLGVPAGVQTQRLFQFNQSINNSKKYNLPEGVYGVYDQNGKLKYTTNFSDLWYGTLLGFPTTAKTEQTKIQKDISNVRFNTTQAKQSFMKLYQQGKYEEANKILSEFRFNVTPADFEAYYIPLNQRLYNSLPSSIKPQFAPKIFK